MANKNHTIPFLNLRCDEVTRGACLFAARGKLRRLGALMVALLVVSPPLSPRKVLRRSNWWVARTILLQSIVGLSLELSGRHSMALAVL